MKNNKMLKICTLVFTVFCLNVEAQNLFDQPQIDLCCESEMYTDNYYNAQNPVRDIEEDMSILSNNDPAVQSLIPADEVWYTKNKPGKFKTEDTDRFISQDVPYDELRYVKIDDKIYYQFFVSEENLKKKYNPKDLDMSIYRGYILWEAQEDISYLANNFERQEGVDSVSVVSQYYIKVYAPVDFVIANLGENYLNPDDGDYPGYFTHMRLKTAPFLPLKTDFNTELTEDKEYRTAYLRAYDLETGEKQAIISMRPNSYPLLPKGYTGNYKDLDSEIKKQLIWVDIPTNEPIRKEILYIIHPEKNATKDAVSDEIEMQIYHNAIEVDNDGSNPFNWVIEAWEGSYYIQVGTMKDETGLFKNHNYARMLDKFDISAINDATDVTAVKYQTYISDTDPTCWDAWIGDCDCITNYQEVGPEVNNMTNNVTAADNTESGGEKDFNSTTWYDDINDGTNYYIDPGWNWDKGDGYTNYDVVYNASGITDFESRLAGNWYVVGVKDRSENNEEPDYWEGIETLNTYSTLKINFIPICANTDLGTITPSQCEWQSSNYSAGTIPYWGFTATTGYYYNFTLCSNSEDSYIRIYDSFNNLVTSSDDSGPFCSGTPASISWTPTTSGTYYISAAHYSCTDFTNAGTMYYSRSNDAWQRQTTITPTTSWQTSPNTIDKISFWTFTATAGTSYAFNLCDIAEDSYIRIFDDTWTQVAYADDYGPCCSSSTSASIVWTCTASGTYYIAGMHWSCTGFYNSGNLNYRISTPTAIADASDTEICSGETITLLGDGTAVCGSIVQYDWDHLAGEDDPQNPDVSPTSDHTYQLRVLDNNGIWSDWTGVFITVHPLPTPDLGGNQTVCISETPVTLSPGVYVDYSWSNSSTDSYINVSTTGTYSVTVTDSNNCIGEDSMDLTVNPLPEASAGGSQTICENGSAIVSGATATYGDVLWTHDGNGTITDETTLTPTYNAVVSDSGETVTLTMTVTSNNACSPQTATAEYYVNVDPLPIATAGDSQSICVNETAIVSGASASYGDILWTEDGAGSITDGETTLTPTYTPAPEDAENTVTLTMTVTSTNTCNPETAEAYYYVNVDGLPEATAGGSETICSNESFIVTGSSASNGTILWTHDGAGLLTDPTTTTPTYHASPDDIGNTVTLTMTVTSDNSCSPEFAEAYFTIFVDPMPVAVAGGSSTICPEEIVNISGASAENGTILWTHDGNGSLTNETTLTPTYNSVIADGGNTVTLTLTVTSINACSPQIATAYYTITVNPLPEAPNLVSSDLNNFCEDDPGTMNLSVTGGVGTEVHWFDDVCGGNEIGTGLILSINTPTITTTYFARWENSCGVSDCSEKTITVVEPPVIPDEAVASINDFCADDAGDLELSVNGGSGETLQWFTGSCGGSSIGNGNPLTIPSPDVTTTYYARWSNICGETDCVDVTVKVNALPVAPTEALVDRNDFCADDPGNIELSVNGGLGDDVHWFNDACGSNEIGIGNPLTIESPDASTTYYARWENLCGESSCVSIAVNVIALPEPVTFVSTSLNDYCYDDPGTIILSAVGGSGDELQWFDDICGGNQIGTSNPLEIESPETSTEFFVRWVNSCGETDCMTLLINTISAPENPTSAEVDFDSICIDDAGNITLTLIGGAGPEVRWYSGSCGESLVGIGNPLSIESPTSNTTYFGRYESSCGISDCESVLVTVVPLPEDPVSAQSDINDFCVDHTGNISLSVTGGSGNDVFWYIGSCGETLLGIGNPLEIESPEITTTYYARWENLCGGSVCQEVTVNVIQYAVIPDLLTSDVNYICTGDPGDVELSAEGGNGSVLRWYTGACEDTEIGTGNPLIIPSPDITTQYFARYENICNITECQTFTVTIIDAPENPDYAEATPSSVCINDLGNITLTLVGGLGPYVEWYTGACDGTLVGTGNPLEIESPVIETTYYGRYVSDCGNSECVSVNVSIIPLPEPPSSAEVDRNNFCSNDDGEINLSVTGGSGTDVYWYTGSCGEIFIGNGNPLTIDSPESTTTYYGKWGNECDSSVCQNVTVSVIPVSDATINAAGPFCETDDPVVITAATPGGTWSGTGIQETTGLFDPEIAGPGEHIISYTSSGICPETDEITITVIELFDATITPVDPLCSNDAEITLTAATAGGTWSGTGITDADAGTFDPTVAGVGNHTITYEYTGSCGDSDDIVIVVNPVADATITPAGPFCATDDPVALTAATAGGTWEGTGITNQTAGLFDPETAGVGDHIITYTISGDCGDSDQITISVIENFDATITPVDPLCSNDAAITLTAATTGGTWSGTGITDANAGAFDPTVAGVGNHTITYEFTGACGDSDEIVIVVNPVADATITPAGPFCEDYDPATLTATQSGGIWSGTGITNPTTGLFDPETAGAGDHIITYTISGDCGDSDQITISVVEKFDATITPVDPLCSNDAAITLTAATTGGTWSGNGITDLDLGSFNPVDAGSGNHQIIYYQSGLCGDADTIYIAVLANADASIYPVDTLYEDDEPITVETVETGGLWSGTGIDNEGIFNPTVSGIGEFEIIYTIEGLCGDSDSIMIYVLPNPIADLLVTNAITPDADGYNDTWKIRGIEAFDNVKINIFDRWGNEIFVFDGTGFQYNDPVNQWNGKFKDRDLPSGSYLFILVLNNETVHKGTISLIR